MASESNTRKAWIAAGCLLLSAPCAPALADEPVPGDEAAEPAAPHEPLALERFGLVGDAPQGATATEMMGGLMVQAPDLVALVEQVPRTRSAPPTADRFLAEVTELYAPQNVTREDLADGWLITFTNEGNMGPNFWVHVHRTIDGEMWRCTTTSSTETQQKNAVAFCKSLRAKP